MLRVTIELVPYGVEAMAKTIAELCIANVGTDQETNVANYEVAGYHLGSDKKIEEFAVKIADYDRDEGALKLVGDILLAPKEKFEEVKLAEQLIQKTRLMQVEEDTKD
jgi:hypothetical protein